MLLTNFFPEFLRESKSFLTEKSSAKYEVHFLFLGRMKPKVRNRICFVFGSYMIENQFITEYTDLHDRADKFITEMEEHFICHE